MLKIYKERLWEFEAWSGGVHNNARFRVRTLKMKAGGSTSPFFTMRNRLPQHKKAFLGSSDPFSKIITKI